MTDRTPSSDTTPSRKRSKGLKITLISLGSILALIVVAFCVACWLLFTPARLTAIVNKVSNEMLTCHSDFERVELTLFKTFPQVGLDVQKVVLVNPMEDSPNDTVARVDEMVVGFNLRKFLQEGNIEINRVVVDGMAAHLFVDSLGNNNFTIFSSTDTTATAQDTAGSTPLPSICLNKLTLQHINATYTDRQQGMAAVLHNVEINAKGTWQQEQLNGTLCLQGDQVAATLCDSIGDTTLATSLQQLSLQLAAEGTSTDLNGHVKSCIHKGTLNLAGTAFVNAVLHEQRDDLLTLDAPFHANLDSMQFSLQEATIALAQFALALSGDVTLAQQDSVGNVLQPLRVDARLHTDGNWSLQELLPLLPPQFTAWQQTMTLQGDIALEATAQGVMTDSLMPLVDARVKLMDGTFADPSLLPYTVKKIAGDIEARVDLSSQTPQPSQATIHSLTAKVANSNIALSGTLHDLLDDFLADVRLQGTLSLPDAMPFLPDSLPLEANGTAHMDIKAKSTLSQLSAVALDKMKVQGTIYFSNLDVMFDSMTAASPALSVALAMDPTAQRRLPNQLLTATVTSGTLHAAMQSDNLDATVQDLSLEAALSNITDTTQPLAIDCKLRCNKLCGSLDSLSACIAEPDIAFAMQPRDKNNKRVDYTVRYDSRAIHVKVNDSLSADIAGLTVAGSSHYNDEKENILAKWSPDLDIQLRRAYVQHAALPYTLQMPNLLFNYRPEKCAIEQANIVFGNSDYYLQGEVFNIEQWLSHEALLTGDLHFTSNYTNVDDLMAVFSGMGSDADSLAAQREEENVPKEANPFIVPKDVDFTLHTRVKEAYAFGNDLQEVAGDVRIKDGVAVLDQVGFVCQAARMQLTAMYRTPRVNHLFLGMDFHLLDIGVSELIDMIPYVDTIVPMLSAFDGHANFHLAAETYLDAFYQPKMSTLRGAANINGDSLVVLDNKTFRTISKYMLFSKKTKNVIDSLDVNLTVFRNEVELYPFILTMDKYKVCAAGRHNLDNNYDYHLEILKSPLPLRLALDVRGVMPKLGFKLSKVRYAQLYQPEKHNDLQRQTEALSALIRKSLESNVRESTRSYQGLQNGNQVETK